MTKFDQYEKICILNATGEWDEKLEDEFDPDLLHAILSKDENKLEEILGKNTTVSIILAPSEDEDDDSEEPQEDTEEKIAI